MKGKNVPVLGILLVLILGGGGELLWAEYAPYNRPNPLMDYVPQEIGIYDTNYWELTESDCRGCHGNSLADRHHATSIVMDDEKCTPCHEIIEEDPGVIVKRDCVTTGCHSWDDVGPLDGQGTPPNGWHHDTDLSESQNCIACHNPNLIAEITPFRDFETYPPSVVTPTPFSCENCHWGQEVEPAAGGFDPDTSPESDAGHPSTYNHYNKWGMLIGYHEYGRAISGNFYTHHMGEDGDFKGNVASQCDMCHSLNPNYPQWDHDNPELIRYCEICHDIATLHTIFPHVGPVGTGGGIADHGWEATGFHLDGSPGTIPDTYRPFEANEQCFGCHGDDIVDPTPPPVAEPAISSIQPTHGSCGAIVTLRGENLGQEHEQGYDVQVKPTTQDTWPDPPHVLPIYSWTDTLIEFVIPCWGDKSLLSGNYHVRVKTPTGNSNQLNFTVENHLAVSGISPAAGECQTWITISGLNFGNGQSKMFGNGYGVHHIVDFVASQGTFTALSYQDWNPTNFEVEFSSFFVDREDPATGQRNFVQDEDEPLVTLCDGIFLGSWNVYVKAIYFRDEDGCEGLSSGDTIFQVLLDDPEHFELALGPNVYRLNPTRIENHYLLKIYGQNFGLSQGDGQVRFGSEDEASNPVLLKGQLLGDVNKWGSTVINVQVDVPQSAEGSTWLVWVEKNWMKSNYRSLEILPALSADSDGDGVENSNDNCPNAPNPGQEDSDGDGVGDACDGCSGNPDKTSGGICGCGLTDTDSDGDGTPDCNDGCPNDPNKTAPGASGCGTPEPKDFDGDGVPDGEDNCPNWPNLGQEDSDGDGFGDFCDACPGDANNDADGDGVCAEADGCPDDPNKTEPGACGCGIADTDSDTDGTADCNDGCPNDSNKIEPGTCGCGIADTDSDADGTADCSDGCPNDSNKTEPGTCDCGTPDTDSDNDGTLNCIEDAAPNQGDGNNDKENDSNQNNVVSFRTHDGKYVTLAVSDPASLSDCGASDAPDGAPQGVEFKYGLFSFTMNGIKRGQSVTVAIYIPDGASPTTYYKHGPEPGDNTDHWYKFMYDGETGAEINGNVITLHFVDGKRGDDDLTANGIITDQGGPGFTSSTTSATSTKGSTRGSGGGGCFINSAAFGLGPAGYFRAVP